MSLSLIPLFNPSDAGTAPDSGETLGEALFEVEAFAEKSNLPSIGSFADQRDVPEDFDGSPEELDELLGPCTDWFPAAAGAEGLARLAHGIEEAIDEGTAFDGAQEVVTELNAIIASLEDAATKDAQFRLTLV